MQQCLYFSPVYRCSSGPLTYIFIWRKTKLAPPPPQLHGYQTFLYLLVNPLTAFLSLHWERSNHSHVPLSCLWFYPSIGSLGHRPERLDCSLNVLLCLLCFLLFWWIWLRRRSALLVETGGKVQQDCYLRVGEGRTNKTLFFSFFFKKNYKIFYSM